MELESELERRPIQLGWESRQGHTHKHMNNHFERLRPGTRQKFAFDDRRNHLHHFRGFHSHWATCGLAVPRADTDEANTQRTSRQVSSFAAGDTIDIHFGSCSGHRRSASLGVPRACLRWPRRAPRRRPNEFIARDEAILRAAHSNRWSRAGPLLASGLHCDRAHCSAQTHQPNGAAVSCDCEMEAAEAPHSRAESVADRSRSASPRSPKLHKTCCQSI